MTAKPFKDEDHQFCGSNSKYKRGSAHLGNIFDSVEACLFWQNHRFMQSKICVRSLFSLTVIIPFWMPVLDVLPAILNPVLEFLLRIFTENGDPNGSYN